MTFDAPDSNVCTVRRERSNTPLQALTLLNDVVFVEAAQALAQRVLDELPNEPACVKIERLVRLRLWSQCDDRRAKSVAEALQRVLPSGPVGFEGSSEAVWVLQAV